MATTEVTKFQRLGADLEKGIHGTLVSCTTRVKPTARRHVVAGGWAAPACGCLICITKPHEGAHFLTVVSLIFLNRTQVHTTTRKCALPYS